MKKISQILILLFAFILLGCGSSDDAASSDANLASKDETVGSANSASENTQAASLYAKCAGCHGEYAEKKALGKSDVIANYTAHEVQAALNGYMDGSYGGAMKGLMKGQVASLSESDVRILSNYISHLENVSKSIVYAGNLNSAELGSALYTTYIKPSCDLNINEFSELHTKDEWMQLMEEELFKDEVQTSCPESSLEILTKFDLINIFEFVSANADK